MKNRNPKPPFCDTLESNLNALERINGKWGFHDMVIDSINRVNRRVVISIDRYFLVFTGVVRWRQEIEEFPTVWLNHSLKNGVTTATLHADLEMGTIDGEFENLRLITMNDFSVIIPPLDPRKNF